MWTNSFRLLTFIVISTLFSCSNSIDTENEKEKIRSIIMDQQKAWNSFDIPAFMEAYWNSPEMSFVSKNGVVKGWNGMKARYEKNYPNQDAMGSLNFELKEINITDQKSAMVIGSWHLTRPVAGDIGGYFTLVLRKIDGEWKIISDHTS